MQIYAARTPSPCPTCLPPFPTARMHLRRRPSKIGPAGRHLPAAHCKLQLNVRRSSRQTTSAHGSVSRVSPVHTAIRNCTRDEGGPFEVGNQVLISSHRKLLLSKAMVVSVAETAGRDPVRQG